MFAVLNTRIPQNREGKNFRLEEALLRSHPGTTLIPVSSFWLIDGESRRRRMRQLKGKPKKETSRDKKERKQAMQEARQQVTTVVLPTLAVVVLLIVVFVYVATRPNTTE
ncbi:single-pass membrane and coiled-coil domain-containing protein 4 isoform X1 [Podarcis raffonei]|nr:single-pass membrane and coiled-coil domain-containing protein 4 isoform X1 [Podarcis raffonei]